jgi:BirA family transcriptional regulator, biotin operon repressor / biotin---[acetyl-CoA-carboxylase] ligase
MSGAPLPLSGAALPELPSEFRLLAFDRLGSTSDEGKLQAAANAPEGTLVWALEQTAGRGRRERQWVSPRGNLFMSLVLRPAVEPARAAELGFVASLAVADALTGLLGPAAPVELKWPNDVLVGGAKIAGILLEAQSSPQGIVDWIVLGIGVNLAASPDDLPYPATDLAALGVAAQPADMLRLLAAALARRLDAWRRRGFTEQRGDWLARARGRGRRIEVRQGDTILEGCFLDLDADGALVLETAQGIRRIAAGEVHFMAA